MTAVVELPVWQPSPERIAASNITRFAQQVREKHGVANAENYHELWQWSVDHSEEFWPAVWDFCRVIGSRGQRVVENGDRMPGARWFPEARLNYAENLLRRRDESLAIVAWNETGPWASLTFAQLYDQTSRLSAALRAAGLEPGDRVAAMLPNLPEAIVAMLATAAIGATFSSCSPDFGVAGAVDRFGQIAPRVLLVPDGYTYAGKQFDTTTKATAILEQVPSIEICILVPYLDREARPPNIARWRSWQDMLAPPPSEIDFAQSPFDHPLYILFSSGTTGPPKCIVHGAGGTLIQHLKEHVLHTDLKPGDRLFYFTTLGWMMWNWLASALAAECTLVLFDGSPFHPRPQLLWDMADAEQVTAFGTSAKYLSALEKVGAKPRHTHSLASLRTILSTGSPLAPESFDYVYRDIKEDV